VSIAHHPLQKLGNADFHHLCHIVGRAPKGLCSPCVGLRVRHDALAEILDISHVEVEILDRLKKVGEISVDVYSRFRHLFCAPHPRQVLVLLHKRHHGFHRHLRILWLKHEVRPLPVVSGALLLLLDQLLDGLFDLLFVLG